MSASRPQSDEELMGGVQAGDPGAFGELYDRHAALALRVARTVDRHRSRAEDAVQEGFLSIWRSRMDYRPDVGPFQGWAMAIIRHRAVDSFRSESAGHRPQPADVKGVIPDMSSGSMQDAAIARSEGDALRASLKRLPPAQAEVIALAFFGELSHSEIAAQLSLPEGTVKGRMRLGLSKLRSQMQRAA